MEHKTQKVRRQGIDYLLNLDIEVDEHRAMDNSLFGYEEPDTTTHYFLYKEVKGEGWDFLKDGTVYTRGTSATLAAAINHAFDRKKLDLTQVGSTIYAGKIR